MNFTTKIPIQKHNSQIDYSSTIVLLGSCFAESMGEKFEYFKFQNWVNPFGIIFNPVSIEQIISRIAKNEKFTDEDVFFHNELWHCFEVHSELSSPNKEEFIEILNQRLEDLKTYLATTTHVIITYGTSWVYRNKTSQKLVANCHKVSQNQFEKEILSTDEIEVSITNTIQLIENINPDCQFIFTVSPVRHIRDGFIENNVSKAHLITALHQTVNNKPQTVNYFPSYEIMMDELRDYRFYANDMLHPSQIAVDYIWIQFFENYVAQSQFSTMQEVCDIQKALAHKPFNPDTKQHMEFNKKIREKIKKLESKFASIRF